MSNKMSNEMYDGMYNFRFEVVNPDHDMCGEIFYIALEDEDLDFAVSLATSPNGLGYDVDDLDFGTWDDDVIAEDLGYDTFTEDDLCIRV